MNLGSIGHTLGLILQITDTKTKTVSPMPPIPQKPRFTYQDVDQPFVRTSPERQGIPSSYLQSFLEEVEAKPEIKMQNLLILRGDKVLLECGYGANHTDIWKAMFSASKSITALAIGMLIAEKKLKESDLVAEILSDKISALDRLSFRDLTVRHLLTMTSGAFFNETTCISERDWQKCFFNSGLLSAPGKEFRYNSLNTYILSCILRRISGVGLVEYLTPRLFEPLGIHNVYWETSPEGIEKGGWGLYILPEDMVKIGRMVLNGGIWQGKRILPARWLQRATSVQVRSKNTRYDYGYQIWVSEENHAFLFNGMFGQNMLAFRDSDIILMTNAGNDEIFQQPEYFSIAEKYFAKLPESLQLDHSGRELRSLRSFLGYLSQPALIRKAARNGTCRMFDSAGNTDARSPDLLVQPKYSYVFSEDQSTPIGLLPFILQALQNNYTKGIRGFSFVKKNEKCITVTYTEEDETYTFPVGLEEPEETTLFFHGEPYLVRSVGRFTYNEDDDPVLVLQISFVETPCTRIIKCFFTQSGNVRLIQSEFPGEKFVQINLEDILKGLEDKQLLHFALSKVDRRGINEKLYAIFNQHVLLVPQPKEGST